MKKSFKKMTRRDLIKTAGLAPAPAWQVLPPLTTRTSCPAAADRRPASTFAGQPRGFCSGMDDTRYSGGFRIAPPS